MDCLRLIKNKNTWLLNLSLDSRCFSQKFSRISSERTESTAISELLVIITEIDPMIWSRIESLIETVTHLHEHWILESIILLIQEDWMVWVTSHRMIHEESLKGINTSFKHRILILLELRNHNRKWKLRCCLSFEIETAVIHQNIWSMRTNRLNSLCRSTVRDQTKVSPWHTNTNQSSIQTTMKDSQVEHKHFVCLIHKRSRVES